ncbi:MAG: cation:dicarboxylase symporter family transporter [Candidatus Eisenbacteria bacterium]|nr:cation:dicarboxylase symporter family transporter [Candidatus Eisenbacteria bacterium]
MKADRILLYLLLAGIVAGGLCGWLIGEAMSAWDWVGKLFLNALKMLIVPLIVSSMVMAVAELGDVRRLGRAGGMVILYYFATTAIAVLIGIVMVNLIQPGSGVILGDGEIPEVVAGKEKGIADIVLSLVSPNIIEAAARMDVLPLIVFSLFFGAILTTLGEKGRPVVRVFDGINDAILKMVRLIMWIAPLGVFALVASRLGQAGGGTGIANEVAKIGKYFVTVLIGLGIHGFVVLPLLLRLLGRRRILPYAGGMTEALSTAWSTASSSATLPITMRCAQDHNRVSRRSAMLVMPLGATINMDGTALYEAVAAIFIAQATGFPLGAGDQVIIFLTATLAAIGAAGIPEAGLVTMVIVLNAVGLPLEGIGLILTVDWFLDRFRTTVNVWGDSVGTAVLDRLYGTADEPRPLAGGSR